MKPGPAHLRRHDTRISGQIGDDLLRQRTRIGTRRLGQHHGRVGRKVAMSSIARRFDDGAGDIQIRRQIARALQIAQRLRHPLLESRKQIHLSSVSMLSTPA